MKREVVVAGIESLGVNALTYFTFIVMDYLANLLNVQ